MIMADKIIELRKKNGWSQEELAELLNVSRQSVSKWEGAQSVPELSKVVAMADVFGVSTDYLLKDELVETEYVEERKASKEIDGEMLHRISMEEANLFLQTNVQAAKETAFATALCIFSVVPLILLGLLGERADMQSASGGANSRMQILVNSRGGIIGHIIMFLLIAGAVFLFIRNGLAAERYAFLENEMIETEYGVSGMVREKKKDYERTHGMRIGLGVVLCIVAVISIFICAALDAGNDMLMGGGISIMLMIIAAGVYLLVLTSMQWDGYNKLLEEGDEYSRDRKRLSPYVKPVLRIYWALVLALYLGYSFVTNDWGRSWILWPVAAVCSPAVKVITEAVAKRRIGQ